MEQTVALHALLEKREGVVTGWDAFPLEPMPGIRDWVLPANSAYPGARFYVTIRIADERQHHDQYWTTRESQIEAKAQVGDDELNLTAPGTEHGGLPGEIGHIGLNGFDPAWFEDSDEVWVTLTMTYDPGATQQMWGHSRAELIEKQHESSYESPEHYPEMVPVELPEPAPDEFPDSLDWSFPEVDLSIDHSGIVVGQDRELRLPMAIRYGFVCDETLVLLLEAGSEGVDDPDHQIPEYQSVIGVNPDCSLKWIVEETRRDSPYRGLWTVNGTPRTTLSGNKVWYEIDPETSSVDEIEPFYGQF